MIDKYTFLMCYNGEYKRLF